MNESDESVEVHVLFSGNSAGFVPHVITVIENGTATGNITTV